MKSISRIISVIIILFVSELTAQNNESDTWEPLMQAIENILDGKPIDDKNIIIASEAYLVCGNTFENLNSVISGESISCQLKEDAGRGSASIVAKIKDNAAYLTLKTQTIENTEDRFHTVIFMKNSSDKWVIHAWHTSS